MMVLCEMTNYLIIIPTKNTCADTVAEALYSRVFGIFGIPKRLNSDEDKALTGEVIAMLLGFLRIELKIISPWNHGSLKVERHIRTFQEVIIKALTKHGGNWPTYVPACVFAINTFASDALGGFSPHELVFCRKPPDPLNVNFAQLNDAHDKSHDEYVALLRSRSEFIQSIIVDFRARQTQSRALKDNQYRKPFIFSEGQLVALLAPTSSDLKTGTKKFVQQYIGPLTVQQVLDDTHVVLQSIDSQTLPYVYHTNRLRPWQEFHPEGNITTQHQLIEKAFHNPAAISANPDQIQDAAVHQTSADPVHFAD